MIKKINIKPSALIIPFIFIITNNIKMFLIIFCAALLHEAAHIFVISIMGNKIQKIEARSLGMNIVKSGHLGYGQDIMVALSGPAVNLVLFISSYFIWLNYLPLDEISLFCGVNLMLFLINMIPVLPLDGGRALYSILMLKLEVVSAQNLFFWVSFFVSILLFIAGCYIFISTKYNLSLIIISLFLVSNIAQYDYLYTC